MRRHNRGSNIWKMLGDSIAESVLGRIHWLPNMWANIGSRWDRNRALRYSDNAPIFTNDKLGVLVRGRATHCPHPPGDDFYHYTEAGRQDNWSVPASLCRKCEFHQPRRRGVPYPCCLFKAEKKPAEAAAKKLDEIVTKAVDETQKMMGVK